MFWKGITLTNFYPNEFYGFRNGDDDHDHEHEHEHEHHGGHMGMICPMMNMHNTMNMPNMMNMQMGGMHMMHQHESLINTIQHCEMTCEHMTMMLKHKADINARVKQLSLLHDCADICTLTAKYISRMSSFSKATANLCAQICEVCGNECARFADAESQHCAQVCHHCARECRNFAMSMM
jgi:hypothetical protein